MKRFMLTTALLSGILFGCGPDDSSLAEPVSDVIESPAIEEGLSVPNELGIDYRALYDDPYVDLGAKKTVDQPLPPVILPDLTGTEHDLSELIGEPMIIEFASTTCVYCQEMEPVISAYKAANPDIHVVQIYDLEEPEVVKAAMQDKEDGILRLVAEDAVMSEMFESYYTPTMYYVDSKGIVRMLSIGVLTEEELEMNVAKTESVTQPE